VETKEYEKKVTEVMVEDMADEKIATRIKEYVEEVLHKRMVVEEQEKERLIMETHRRSHQRIQGMFDDLFQMQGVYWTGMVR